VRRRLRRRDAEQPGRRPLVALGEKERAEMIRVQANRDTCEGFGTCVLVSETLFDIDDEGLVVVKQDLLADELLAEVREAAYNCPTDSISFVENADSN
jgi:ferredoxin